MAQMTLLELAKLRGNDAAVGLIEENRLVAPEVGIIPARTIPGFSFRTVTRKKQAPQISFLNVNQGYPTGVDIFENNLIQCHLIGQLVQVAKSMLQVSGDAIENLLALDASRVLRDALLTIGTQTFYGTDTKGFPGLSSSIAAAQDTDAGGTTANTKSSVYGVKLGIQDVNYIFGGSSTFALSDTREQVLSVNGGNVPSFVADMSAWVGLQVGNIYSVARIKNCTTANPLTDKLVAQLLRTMPIGNRPDVLFMGRDAAYQLQSSRSTTQNSVGSKTVSGVEVWAPFPTESNGIPITVTDSLVGTEP